MVLIAIGLVVSRLAAYGVTYDLPFLAANYSKFDPAFADTVPSPTNRRVMRFTIPGDFAVDSTSLNYDPTFGGSVFLAWPAGRPTEMTRPVPGMPTAVVRGRVLVDAAVSVVVRSHFYQTLDEVLAGQFGLPPRTAPIGDVDVRFTPVGGSALGPMRLKGRGTYGVQSRVPTGTSSIIADARYCIALEWGTDPTGSPLMVQITFTAGAGAFTDDATVLPPADVAAGLLGTANPATYLQSIIDRYLTQPAANELTLSGAVPELLVLYDFGGTNSVLPETTIPPYASYPDASGSYQGAYRFINQYDSGASESLPSRYGKPGGNACGPTALRMALAVRNLFFPAADVYQNSMEKGLTVVANETNAFSWWRARDWLESNTNSFTDFSTPSGLPAGTHAEILHAETTAQIATTWGRIDLLLTNSQQPVLFRTDLSSGSTRGGGHVILLLGKGRSDLVRDAYGLSGDYYIVVDPAGHYFANSNATHYGTVTNLMAQAVGINYGGWFASYPAEWVHDRIQRGGVPRITALTIGSPFPALRVDGRSPVAITVTDPLGRKTGVLSTGSVFQDIPDSWFSFALGDEEDGQSVTYVAGIKTVLVHNPLQGGYLVEVTGTGNGAFTLDWSAFDTAGQPSFQSLTNTITTGQTRSYAFTFGQTLPRLSISTVPGGCVLTWPTNATGFNLQSTTNLLLPNSWTLVTIPAVTNEAVIRVTNSTVRAIELFRLVKP